MLKSKHYNARGLFFSERLTTVLRKIPDYFLTIVEGSELLTQLGETVLREGAQEIVFERVVL